MKPKEIDYKYFLTDEVVSIMEAFEYLLKVSKEGATHISLEPEYEFGNAHIIIRAIKREDE